MIARISGIIQQLLLIWLVLFSVVAYFWIDLAGVDSLDPFAATRPALGLMISLTMFCIGCLITVDEIDEVFRRWPTVLGGTRSSTRSCRCSRGAVALCWGSNASI